jgi:NADH:ubiquinone oxidoreductase subunit 6 (subunit J)
MFRSGAKRCLNCDTVMTGPVCEGCELTEAAASLVVRRKVILRTGMFLLGSLAFVAAAYRFPPLEMDGMLVFCGAIFFLGLAMAVWVERGAMRGSQIAIRKRLFMTLVPVPWLLAALLVVNAKLDNAPVRDWTTRVVEKFSMSAMVPTRRLVVVSWREGHRYERVPVSSDEYSRFHVGERVVVQIHPGLAGIPWVAGVVASGSNSNEVGGGGG